MIVRRVFLSPLWLILSVPGYIGWRLLPALSIGPIAMCTGIAFLIACCVVLPLSERNRSIRNPRLADLFSWIGLLSMGFFSSLFVFTLLRDIVLLGALVLLPAHRAAVWAIPTARWTLVLTALVTLAGLVIARRRPRIVDVEIPISGLPKALHGFSIAQISDVHVGPTIKRGFVEGVVARVNGLKADLIAVTGDLVDGSVGQLSAHTAGLGLRVLKNEHVVLRHNGASLVLAGVTDLSAHHFDAGQHSDPVAALRGAPADAGARILLAHQPNSADVAAGAGFDVQLSGHTHGGQFWPWNLFIGFFQPFAGGLYRLKNLWVYVSRGTGCWGPPNRFGAPSEITRIRLIAAAP